MQLGNYFELHATYSEDCGVTLTALDAPQDKQPEKELGLLV
jgi:hypothetical protein